VVSIGAGIPKGGIFVAPGRGRHFELLSRPGTG
jgi:hypothetical protein